MPDMSDRELKLRVMKLHLKLLGDKPVSYREDDDELIHEYSLLERELDNKIAEEQEVKE